MQEVASTPGCRVHRCACFVRTHQRYTFMDFFFLMYAIIQGFCKTVPVGMAVAKTIRKRFRGRKVWRTPARGSVLNPRLMPRFSGRQGLGEGEHTSTRDQDSRNFQGPHCQTRHPPGPPWAQQKSSRAVSLSKGTPARETTPTHSFPLHLGHEGTPWDFESSPSRKTEFSKVQNPLKRNGKGAALTL